MAAPPTVADARQSLTEHVIAKGREIFVRYGPQIGWAELQRLLADRAQVRYPCEIIFDAAPLRSGEFAHPVPKGATPEEGFAVYVHPVYRADLAQVPLLVLYQIVAVNYGDFASVDDAESFGAAAFGLSRDDYYARVCALADHVPADPDADVTSAGIGETDLRGVAGTPVR
jgi:hypothetical protein